MADSIDLPFKPIPVPDASGATASHQVIYGKLIAPQQQILIYSPDDWERFIEEWVTTQKSTYVKVLRYSGANDMGIDVAGFTDAKEINGVWDNFQCKHYDESLTPSTAATEIGKVLWHTYQKKYSAPRSYYFIAPKDCGISLKRALANPPELKKYVVDNWDKYCKEKITTKLQIELTNDFLTHVEKFDFSIFSTKSSLEIIEEHKRSPWFAIRFGGGIGERPAVDAPPKELHPDESRYIAQLFEAYSDHKKRQCLNS